MYKLTCPSCHRTTSLPFARIGSIATCPGCGKQYRIRENQLTREVRIRSIPPDEVDPLLPDGPASSSTREMGPGFAMEGSGLSGLSRLMEEAGTQRTRPDRRKKESLAAREPPERATKRKHRHPRRRSQRLTYLVSAGSLAAVLLLGVLLWLAGWPRDRVSGIPTEHAVPVAAMPLITDGWTKVADAAPDHTPAKAPSVVISDRKLIRISGTIYFSAVVTNKGSAVIRQAQVQLVILDANHHPSVRTHLPIALLGPEDSESIRMALPVGTGLNAQVTARVVSEVAADASVVLQKHVAIAAPSKQGTVVVRLKNNAAMRLSEVEVLITALDQASQPLSRWLVSYEHTLRPRQSLTLEVQLGAEALPAVDHWQVRIIGKP